MMMQGRCIIACRGNFFSLFCWVACLLNNTDMLFLPCLYTVHSFCCRLMCSLRICTYCDDLLPLKWIKCKHKLLFLLVCAKLLLFSLWSRFPSIRDSNHMSHHKRHKIGKIIASCENTFCLLRLLKSMQCTVWPCISSVCAI